MRKIGKSILTIVVILFSLLAAGLTALSFGMKLVDQSGWSQSQSGAVYYLDWEGQPQTGWKSIGGSRYYFDPVRHGAMTVGWLQIEDSWYYFDDSGMMQTGWLDLLGSRFFLRQDGSMAIGWQEVDDEHYYFDEEGELQVGWLELDDLRFYLGVDGSVRLGWQDTVQGRCYLTPDGTVYSGWQDIDGHRYFFSEDGFLTYGWLSFENEYYYLDEHGIMQTGWMNTPTGRYYLDDAGRLKTGWLNLEEGRYFLGTDGIMQTGWVNVGDFRYYLDEDGLMQTGWMELEGHQYYLNENGRMHTGWLTHSGARYYFDEEGTMCTGKVVIDGVNRYFTSWGEYVVLVNWENPVPNDYTTDLVYYGDYQVDRSCLAALEDLLEDCAAAGCDFEVNSAYRSWQDQQDIWDSRYAQYLSEGYSDSEAWSLVSRSVAVPGTSEHHLGVAVDVGGDEYLFSWLRENSWKYGFIVRYPEGKTDYTGIIYEPWHIRYVGQRLAKELYDLDLCMEEYMEQLTK